MYNLAMRYVIFFIFYVAYNSIDGRVTALRNTTAPWCKYIFPKTLSICIYDQVPRPNFPSIAYIHMACR